MDQPYLVNDRQAGDRAELVDRQTEPARRALLPLQCHQAPLTQRLQRFRRGARVDPETFGDLAGRGAGHQPAVLDHCVEGDLLEDHPHQRPQSPPQRPAFGRQQHRMPSSIRRRLRPGSSRPDPRRSRVTPAKSRYSR